MALTTSRQQFFGLDLQQVAAHARRSLDTLARSRWVARLAPPTPVRLLRADGTEALWLVQGERFWPDAGATALDDAAVTALELPGDRFLRRTLTLPALTESEQAEAVALDVAAASPFPGAEVVWGHTVQPGDGGLHHIHAVLTSRQHIDEWLAAQATRIGIARPELWALAGLPQPVVLAGYGEGTRQAEVKRRLRINLALLGTAAVLLAAVALTPTLQLRAKAIGAGQAYEQLHNSSGTAVARREQVVALAERASAVHSFASAQFEPLKVIEALTRAVPDDAWLLSLKVEGLTATLSGNATNAASLMQRLEGVPGMREVRATSPATRRHDGAKESFVIEVKLDPAVYGRLPAEAQP